MKQLIGIILAGVLLAMAAPLHLDNAYLRSPIFDEVTVARRETLWGIAARYTTDETQARHLVEAIIEVNGLAPDGRIRAGQHLQVPVLGRDRAPRLAGK